MKRKVKKIAQVEQVNYLAPVCLEQQGAQEMFDNG
jgi:hypothetical protein